MIFGEAAADFDGDRFAVAVAPGPSRRPSVRVYSASERRLVSAFEIPDVGSDLHLAMAGGKHSGVLTAAYRGPASFWSLDGKLLWRRGDLRKIQSVGILRHGSLGVIFGAWKEPHTYHLLNPVMGGTRHLLASCTAAAASFDGATILCSRRGRWLGAWIVEQNSFEPAMRRVHGEEPAKICPGPDSFLITVGLDYAAIDFSGALLWRRRMEDRLYPLAWSKKGYWIARATVVSNEILAVAPDGAIETLRRLPQSYIPECALLAGGTLLAGADGKLYDIETGAMTWDFSET